MTQASQQLPSWLTLSSTLVTEPDGSVSTSFATLRLPLTYFGPSVSYSFPSVSIQNYASCLVSFAATRDHFRRLARSIGTRCACDCRAMINEIGWVISGIRL